MLEPLDSAVKNKATIKEILIGLTESIQINDNDKNNCGLLGGLAGELLFLFQLSRYNENVNNEQVFTEKLSFLQEQLPAYVAQPDLSRGLTGQGWFLEFINQAQGSEYDPELCEEIDNILTNTIASDTWHGEIEMVLGLSGIAAYAARRAEKLSSNKLYDIIIGHYEALAIQTSNNTLSWSQPANSVYRFNKEAPESLEFNLGLAHGVPSIIASLLPALKLPNLHSRTKTLLIQSCDWLIGQELEPNQSSSGKKSISCFDSYCTGYHQENDVLTDKKSNEKSGSRLGWCYGDLTIALTLARVGNALDLPSYIDKAKALGLHAAKRDHHDAAILDAGLCHGSAGLALIFQLLHQQVQAPELLSAANKWLTFTLTMYQEKGLDGLFMYSALSKEYEKDTSLLMGYSGIGLCLLSALGQEADWADCLLMA